MKLTQDELLAHIKDVVSPLIKETNSAELADMVEAKVVEAVNAKNAPPAWAEGLMGEKKEAAPEAKTRTKGEGFGRIVRAVACARLDGGGSAKVIESLKQSGDEDLAIGVEKALGAGTGPAGGYLVPTQQSSEIVELRRAATVVRGSGAREIPLPTGTLQVPKLSTGATGTYVGENQNITKSEETLGQLTLTAKKLAVLVPMSNTLLRTSSPSVDAMVRDDIVQSLANTEDAKFLRGTGTDKAPKGLRYLADNVFNAVAASAAGVASDLGIHMQALLDSNTPAGNWRWVFSPRTWRYIYTLVDGSNNSIYRAEMSQGTLFGFPFSMTTAIPNTLTLGGNDDCSEIYLFNPNDIVIGDNLDLSISASDTAAYYDGSSVQASFSLDQTVIRAISEHDMGARHEEAISVSRGVRWGV